MSKKQKHISFKRLASATLAAAVLIAQFVPIGIARAYTGIGDANLTHRSLTLAAGSTGDSATETSAIVNHTFSFTTASGYDVAAVRVMYCTTAAPADITADFASNCTVPTGLSTQTGSPATALANNGGQISGLTFASTVNGVVNLTRSAAAATAGETHFTITNVTNPSSYGTFFARILIYSDAPGGTVEDSGTVAASTSRAVHVQGYMPESLVFCAGATVSRTAGVPDCTTVTTGTVSFNQLFSPQDTAYTTSQMAASTNATYGYVITVNGTTPTNGSVFLDTMGSGTTPADPAHGISQFGLNVVHNTGRLQPGNTTYYASAANPAGFGYNIDEEIAGSSNGTSTRGEAANGYDEQDKYIYDDGATVAGSGYNGTHFQTPGPSDAQIYTVSYIANVTGNQPAGTYATDLTYICTPTF